MTEYRKWLVAEFLVYCEPSPTVPMAPTVIIILINVFEVIFILLSTWWFTLIQVVEPLWYDKHRLSALRIQKWGLSSSPLTSAFHHLPNLLCLFYVNRTIEIGRHTVPKTGGPRSTGQHSTMVTNPTALENLWGPTRSISVSNNTELSHPKANPKNPA